MMKGFYYPHRNAKNPINNADIIYTPDVTVFKTDTNTPRLMDEKDWYDVDVDHLRSAESARAAE